MAEPDDQHLDHLDDDPMEDHPKVWIRPPILFLLVFLIGAILELYLESTLGAGGGWDDFGYWILAGVLGGLGWILAFLGVLLMAGGILQFITAGTNVPTNQPAIDIVDTGLYSMTRNPIYIGMITLTLGLSFAFNAPALLVTLGIAIPVLRYGVIAKEEEYLSDKFGAEYDDYRERVGRWFWSF